MSDPKRDLTIAEAQPDPLPRRAIHSAYEGASFRASLTSLWEIEEPAADSETDP